MAILPVDQSECGRCKSKGHARRRQPARTMALLALQFCYIPGESAANLPRRYWNPDPSTIMQCYAVVAVRTGAMGFLRQFMVPTLKLLLLRGWRDQTAIKKSTVKFAAIYELVELLVVSRIAGLIAVLSALVIMAAHEYLSGHRRVLFAASSSHYVRCNDV